MANPTLNELLFDQIEYRLNDLHTALPARVQKVYYGAQGRKIDAQPTIKKLYLDGVVVDQPVITGIPLVMPGGGGVSISIPVKEGDTVLLIFIERSIDNWVASSGEPVNPQDNRKHDISDAVAIPGLYPFNIAPDLSENDFAISYKGSTIKILENGNIEATCPEFVINSNLQVNGTIMATGAVSTAAINLETHTHTDPQGGVTGPPM